MTAMTTPTVTFTPLPLDYFRCQPVTPDKKCRNCLRWSEQKGQTHGPRTTALNVINSKSKACSYSPISLQETQP
jgi:hypothetical protein